MRKPTRRCYEGEVITLPAEEVAWLRERGFLVDPDAEVPAEVQTGRRSISA